MVSRIIGRRIETAPSQKPAAVNSLPRHYVEISVGFCAANTFGRRPVQLGAKDRDGDGEGTMSLSSIILRSRWLKQQRPELRCRRCQ